MNESFVTSPALKGQLTPRDLLFTQGTFHMFANKDAFDKSSGLLFQLSNHEFNFTFVVEHQSLVLRRNVAASSLTLEEFEEDVPLSIFAMWNYDMLSLKCLQGDRQKNATVTTSPCAPPRSIIMWARKINLIAATEYKSEEHFRNKVCSCLQSIQDKIDETAAIGQFWNTHYNGKAISKREPKRETDVHPTIQCLLSDQMLVAGVELVPEYTTGVGNLDFMFLAKIRNNMHSCICAEFKNAHSPDLYNGLTQQLPCYMRNKYATYGFYCVLNYQGEWFDRPRFNINTRLELQLSKALISAKIPERENIRVLVFNLSKQSTASIKEHLKFGQQLVRV